MSIPGDGAHFGDYDINIPSSLESMANMSLKIISLSDFNALRALKGLDAYDLPDGKYVISINYDEMDAIISQFIDGGIKLNIDTTALTPVAEPLTTVISLTSFHTPTFIVPTAWLKPFKRT